MKKHSITTPPPGPNARSIVDNMKKVSYDSTFNYPLVIANGHDSVIEDIDGNRYIDFTSNIGVSPLGYSHPEISEVLSKYSKIGIHKIAGQDFYCEEHLTIAQKVVSIIPKNFKTFFVNSGAEAVENAIKIAYKKMGALPGVSCTNAFHGRTLGALSFSFSKAVQKANFPELSVRRIKFCIDDEDPEIDSVEKLLKEYRVAFIISETIQGEGGCNVASRKFIKNLRKFADIYGVPLILDEVQSGMGRTGKWWAYEHYGVEPDIMSIAKGLQVGAAAYDKNRFDIAEPGVLSSTWGGGSRIDMAVGAKIIDVIIREKLLDRAARIGELLKKRIEEMVANRTSGNKEGIIKDVRGIGLMIGIEFDSTAARNKKLEDLFKNGLLVLPAGQKSMRVMPPLTITEEEVEEGLDIMNQVF